MKLRSVSVALLVLVIVFGGIATSSVMNMWQTSSTKVPATFKQGEWEGDYDPADIRGSYTLGDVATYFQVPLADLAAAFAVDSAEAAEFQVKNLESIHAELKEQGMEVGTSSVRLFVAWYCGLPFENSESSWLLEPAADLLITKASLSADQLQYLATHSVSLQGAGGTPSGDEHEETEEQQVKGKTTFHELLSWGLSKDEIEGVLGKPMPATQMVVRDFCSQNGLTFSAIKEALQQKLDAIGK